MTGAEPRPPRLYRALLWLYPAAFRAQYGEPMTRIFVERRRAARGPGEVLSLWLATLFDTLVNAARTHWDISRQDLRFAARSLRRTPGWTATVLVVAALGIGANTAAFSLTDHVLLRRLPLYEADRLVVLWQRQLSGGYSEASPANFRDWRSAATSFDGVAAYTQAPANLVGQGEPERLDGAAVTSDLLPLVGARPALGRLFTPEEDRAGAPGTVLLAWGLWQGAFGGDPGIIGRTVTLDDEPCTVIGVMPRGFAFPRRDTEFWRPLRLSADNFEDRSNTYLYVVGRLLPRVTLAHARAELDVISERLAHAYPKDQALTFATLRWLRDELSQQSRVMVLALQGAAGCVLLIACLNLANLLLARALGRRKELSLRTAMGAGRERLVRQLLTESVLLAGGGGLLGVGLAALSLPLLSRLVPAYLPVAAVPRMDLRVLGVAAALTMVSALLFGVGPALRACRDVDAASLREGVRAGASGARARLRRALVIAEVGVSLVLLVSSGLLLRALVRVQGRDPGFRPEGVLTLRTSLPLPRYARTADRARFYQQVLFEARALPGVTSAAYTSFLPMAFGGGIWQVALPGRVHSAEEKRSISLRYLTPEFFATLGIPLLEGRDVNESDGDAPDRPKVAVVSQSFARRFFPGQSPLGRRFEVAFFERTIVGVVGDVRVRGLERDSEPQVYLPYRQIPDGWMPFYAPKDLVVRTSSDPALTLPALRKIIHAADPQLPIADVRRLEDVVTAQTAPRRVQLEIIGTFAALAFLLAAIGIYGLLSFGVSTRAQEIGVRMALGASPRAILGMIFGEALVLLLIGAAAGLALSLAAARSLQALLAGVAPTDPPTVMAALALAGLMAMLGSLVPAWRAARVDPARVMRAD
jgi:putative ABC transport system permease protein